MVLDKGRLVEYGAPFDLLGCNGGSFNEMIRRTGRASSRDLRKRAGLEFE